VGEVSPHYQAGSRNGNYPIAILNQSSINKNNKYLITIRLTVAVHMYPSYKNLLLLVQSSFYF